MDRKKWSQSTLCGGCAAKLPQGLLRGVLRQLPVFEDERLLVGFDSSDDGAVYQVTDELAIVHTTDFFPPMVEDPYLFGKIAAANALSDIFAMGGAVMTALNLVAFPEDGDLDALAEMLRGGTEKVQEAGGVLCGGHSISDNVPKYGLAVTGTVHPGRILRNNTCQIGDKIILTKPLGVGIVMSAHRQGQASEESYEEAVLNMQTLNKAAMEAARPLRVHACTDVTGFGFLGHLNEMVTPDYSICVDAERVPYIPEARRLAEEGFVTGGGAKNRKFLANKVDLCGADAAMAEILFDPQTSGGLLLSVHPEDVAALCGALDGIALSTAIVGEVIPRGARAILTRPLY